jgi:hypothetical protein
MEVGQGPNWGCSGKKKITDGLQILSDTLVLLLHEVVKFVYIHISGLFYSPLNSVSHINKPQDISVRIAMGYGLDSHGSSPSRGKRFHESYS